MKYRRTSSWSEVWSMRGGFALSIWHLSTEWIVSVHVRAVHRPGVLTLYRSTHRTRSRALSAGMRWLSRVYRMSSSAVAESAQAAQDALDAGAREVLDETERHVETERRTEAA